jgi:hypothetical protein
MVEDFFDKPIYSYSRSQAFADGMLVDVTTTAIEAGFNFPVAITRTVWDQFVKVPEGVLSQDQKGRLWDVLVSLHLAIKGRKEVGSTLIFTVHVKNENNRKPVPVKLKSVVGPGDDPSPAITIMLPEET